MKERDLPAGSRILLALLVLAAIGCQPAADVPADTLPAESTEPPPPPPLPTEEGGGPVQPADTPAAQPPPATEDPAPARTPAVAETVPARPPAARPETPPPPERTTPPADCRAPRPAAGGQRLTVFFSCGEEVRPVERAVASTRAVLRSALEQLLRGPTAEERAAGFQSFFGDATAGALRTVLVRDGVAHVDFANFSRAIPNASSSAGSAQLLGQLRATIFQYPSIRAAEITFDGSCDAFWNWLQRGCQQLSRDGG